MIAKEDSVTEMKKTQEQTTREIKRRLAEVALDPGEVDSIYCEMERDGWPVTHASVENTRQAMPKSRRVVKRQRRRNE